MHLYMHAITINKGRCNEFEEVDMGIKEVLKGGMRRETCCNYFSISKIKKYF